MSPEVLSLSVWKWRCQGPKFLEGSLGRVGEASHGPGSRDPEHAELARLTDPGFSCLLPPSWQLPRNAHKYKTDFVFGMFWSIDSKGRIKAFLWGGYHRGTVMLWLQTRAPSGEQELPSESTCWHRPAAEWPCSGCWPPGSFPLCCGPRELALQRRPGLKLQRLRFSAHVASEDGAAGPASHSEMQPCEGFGQAIPMEVQGPRAGWDQDPSCHSLPFP